MMARGGGLREHSMVVGQIAVADLLPRRADARIDREDRGRVERVVQLEPPQARGPGLGYEQLRQGLRRQGVGLVVQSLFFALSK